MGSSRSFLFESWRGRYADNPRAIGEHLAARGSRARTTWVTNSGGDGFPPRTRLVERNSARYFLELARTDVLITNDLMPRVPPRLRPFTYIQTWHGTPLKRIGVDAATGPFALTDWYIRKMREDVRRWHYLVSPSPFVTTILRRAFEYGGPVLEVGYPRNDLLAQPEGVSVRERVRRSLGITPEDRAVLYAPTWRDDALADGTPFDVSPISDGLLSAQSHTPTVTLLRLHPVVAASRPNDAHVGEGVIDVSLYRDIRELLLAADVLLTDYSSVMFDFAVTGRPMIFYSPDLDRYRDTVRGFYFDYEETVPGPIVKTTRELSECFEDIPAATAEFTHRYGQFRERFLPYDDGHASQRVVQGALGGDDFN